MNRLIASKSHIACAALVLAAGTATTASAVDKHWIANGNGSWSNVSSWSPAGQPGPLDHAKIGNVVGVQNSTVLLDLNENIADLDLSDGMTLDTNLFTLDVGIEIDVSGRNIVGMNVFPTRLVVDQIVNGPEVFTPVITVRNQGEVQLVGGGLSVDSLMNIGANSFLRGAGTVSLDSNFVNFRNDGTIAAGSGGIVFYQTGTGLYDLDGTSGGGDLDLTAVSNSSLTFNGDGIFEAFGGTLSMIRGTLLDMNLGEPWAVEASGTFNIYGSGSGSPARITGAPLNFNGTINLYSGSQFSLQSDVTFGVNSELITGLDVNADIAGDATINGGLFTINEGSSLNFNGATKVRGGAFVTSSNQSIDGSVDFGGNTEWDGSISVTGFARQNGPAHVTGPTIISGDTFDMDGANAANWDLDANLTMNVDRIDFSGNNFNNTMDIGVGRLNVNLSDPADSWNMAGTLNIAGNSLLFSTKVGGESLMDLTGTLNVSGKCDIASAARLLNGSTINLTSPTSALRFMDLVIIDDQASFTGDGTLQNGTNSTFYISSGVNTNGVGLHNAGTLSTGGIISVDRFLTTGTWQVSISGYTAGANYDRIVANGPATLGGTLDVQLVDGFRPSVGDEFTILNATGGITGAFAPNVTTTVGSTVYHWDVIVGSADVVLRLASIDDCYANCDGSTATPTLTPADFVCFLSRFRAGDPYANCDGSTATPTLTPADFVCFLHRFRASCP